MSEVTVTDNISGAPFLSRVNATTTTNLTQVKTITGLVFGWVVQGTVAPAAAGQAFLKFYDSAAAVVGTTPVLFTIPLISTANAVANEQVSFDHGIRFVNGIAYAITHLAADSDTTVLLAADLVQGFILWK